mmetsp:Transcript_43280/g.136744  ORF Transcript_43280/g.136744 Transcript_43280/m.136744 type:complete len:212 (+) Transcript_43280:36-671(+)
MVPSVMLSAPNAGHTTSKTVAEPVSGAGMAGAAALPAGAAAAGAAPAGASPGVSVHKGCPTSAVSSALIKISTIVPDCSALTSTLTLSVSITTSRSSFFTWSPTFTFHSMIVPSVMLSAPKPGVFTVTALKHRTCLPIGPIGKLVLKPRMGRAAENAASTQRTSLRAAATLQRRLHASACAARRGPLRPRLDERCSERDSGRAIFGKNERS